jgi:hypothetical protein
MATLALRQEQLARHYLSPSLLRGERRTGFLMRYIGMSTHLNLRRKRRRKHPFPFRKQPFVKMQQQQQQQPDSATFPSPRNWPENISFSASIKAALKSEQTSETSSQRDSSSSSSSSSFLHNRETFSSGSSRSQKSQTILPERVWHARGVASKYILLF